jgi:hypothetical protein
MGITRSRSSRRKAVAGHGRAAVFFDVAEPFVVGEVEGKQEIQVPQAPEIVAYGALAEAVINTLHNGQEVIVVGNRRAATRFELARRLGRCLDLDMIHIIGWSYGAFAAYAFMDLLSLLVGGFGEPVERAQVE